MPIARLALLLSLAAFIPGCTYVTNIQPQETRGGFSVLVDVPGQPASARVVADIDAFARRGGFVHEGGQPGSEQYRLGEIKLDVTYRAANLRVNVYLHSFSHQLSRKFIDRFCDDFRQQYGPAYGEAETIFQTDYSGGIGRGTPGAARVVEAGTNLECGDLAPLSGSEPRLTEKWRQVAALQTGPGNLTPPRPAR